jgi:lipopolysaccharide transport system ATP-binding protein
MGDQIMDLFWAPFRRAGKLLRGQATGAAELDEQFWALEDINFEIKHGDVVGIIGHNGAGKSTLLKILSRITEPTKGYADVYGRISSLLEEGTGFQPELTGREKVNLNGSILGMRKTEIDQKFNDIVGFAEIERFIDTPVKHYSSGMYVRLAFSVAAHLEPEILLVDEVLAVGDIAFQKKCLGKMDNVSREGRTVVFVSHNMNTMQRLCPTSILLNHGRLILHGDTPTVIKHYLANMNVDASAPKKWLDLSGYNRAGSGKVKIQAIYYSSDNEAIGYYPYTNGPLDVTFCLEANVARTVDSLALTIYDQYGTKLVNADTLSKGEPLSLKAGPNEIRLRINQLHLNPGIYSLGFWVANPPSEVFDSMPSAMKFEIIEFEMDKIRVRADGLVTCDFELADIA